MAGFEAKFHGSWQRVAVLKTATADKLMMRNEDIMKPLILKQGSLNFAEKTAMLYYFGRTKLLPSVRGLILTLGLLALTFSFACKKEAPGPAPQRQVPKAQVAAPQAPPQQQVKVEERKIEAETYTYDPKGRRDPFLSIIEASKKEREAEKKKKGLRPAEAYDVSDIKVIAIARDRDRYYAMIQLPDKKYFTIREGMALGIYGGKVIRINAEGVVIREYVKNYKGEIQPKDTILRLRKEEGE